VIVSKALACLSLSQDERSAWAAVKDHIKEPERVTTRLPELQQIREDLRELTATVSKLLSVKSISWAQVAANQSACVTKSLPRKAREVLVTCSLSDAEGRAKTAAEVVRSIRSQPGGDSLITGARKLPSGAFALTFKRIEAKRVWQEQGKLVATFRASVVSKETTLDTIVFGFPKGAMSSLSLS